jgi:hypothetical protein
VETSSVAGSFDLMGEFEEIFREPEGPKQMLGVKITPALRARLDAVVRLWKIRARLRAEAAATDKSKAKQEGEEAAARVDLSHVCTRLLDSGVDKAWGEVLKLADLEAAPETNEQWERLEAALIKHDRTDRLRSK